MTESRLQAVLGVLLIISQFGVILATMYIYVRGGLRFDEMSTAIALLVPMFAVHTTTVVKFFVANKHATNPREVPVTSTFVFLSIFFPVVFVLALLCVIGLKSYGIAFASFNEFRVALGLVQTCFAVYIGLFISSLYENRDRSE
jgi:hypothetical protein